MPKDWIYRALFVAALWIMPASLSQAAGRQFLHGHVPAAVANLQPLGRLPATNRLQLAIGLPLRNQVALSQLLQQLYDPASPNFHHYLTPAQFAEQFGPAEVDYQTVIHFAETNGLTVIGTHPNRVVLDVTGTVADIEKALHLKMQVYQHPREARQFHAPDVEPSVDLTVPVLHISGLDDYSLPHPNLKVQPLQSLNQTTNVTAKVMPSAGSGPSGLYQGNDFRAAYVPGTTLTGAGQSVGLLQYDGYYSNDIASYISQAGISTSVVLSNILINGGPASPGSGDVEVSLDIEMVISMAPGVSKIYVYEGTNGVTPWATILSKMADDDLSRQLSCSWGGGSPDPTSEGLFQQMAVQGQSFFNATGDQDAFSGNNNFPGFPGDSTNITEVGGTTLTTTGPGGAYVSETVWNDRTTNPNGGDWGSSGGISANYRIPSYQQGIDMTANQGSNTMRNVPDVALTAENIYLVYNNGTSASVGGTSCAAPLWAGFAALVNQQAAASGRPSVGFLNPALYGIGKSANYTANFHDITSGDNTWPTFPTQFYAVAGYDLCTGWGSPAGTNLINTLIQGVPNILASGSTLTVEGCTPTNGVVDPGETVTMNFSLQNVGTLNTTNLVATLLATNGVLAPSGPQTYGVLSTNGTTVTKSFTFTASGNCGATITPTFQLQDGSTSLGQASLNFPLGKLTVTTAFTQNFDGVTAPALPAGWTTTATGAQANWVTTTAASDTAPNAAFTAGASSVGVNELVTPAIGILSTTAQLTFRHSYNLQSSGSTSARDGGVLEIQIGSSGFSDILAAGGSFSSGGYNRTISSSRSNPLGGRRAWSGNSGGFITTVVNLPAAAGQTVQLKWRCGTDSGTSSSGWYVDTISISDNYYTCCSGALPSADLALGQSVSPTLVNLGNLVTFTLNVTNLGPNTATNVFVTNTLPAGLNFVTATPAATATNGSILTFVLGNLASSAKTNITIQATAVTAGTRTNTAIVSSATSDPTSANNSATAAVTINSPPTISSIANVITNENSITSPVAFTIGDAETAASALTLSANSSNTSLLPTNNIIFGGSGSNRTVTLTPAANQFGTSVITVSVSDGMTNTSTAFMLAVNQVFHAPLVAPISNYTIYWLNPLTVTVSATSTDVPPQALTFSLATNIPVGATINPTNGVFTWTPTTAQAPSTNLISIIVADVGAPSMTATQNFTVTVSQSNLPPVLSPVADRTIYWLNPLNITNSAMDTNLPVQTLTFSLGNNAPTNSTINVTNGMFSWTPTTAQAPSTNPITVIVTDNGTPSMSATQSFTVTVLQSNLPPILSPISDQTVYALTTLSLTNSASDTNLPTQALTFSLGVSAPTNSTINITNGVFAWTPTTAQSPSTNPISVIVTDNGTPPLSVTQTFNVFVLVSNLPPATFTISGSVALQAFVGTNRMVRFIASEVSAGATNYLQTTNVTLTFSNGTAAYTLPVPTNTTHFSAKTAWNLRRRQAVAFSNGLATVDFTTTNQLPGGDLVTHAVSTNIDDTDNVVSSSDYLLLLGYYLESVGGDTAIGRADIDGDGAVSSLDYLILLGNYLQSGDPP